MNQDFQIRHGSKHYRPCNQYKHRFHYSHHRSLLGGRSVKDPSILTKRVGAQLRKLTSKAKRNCGKFLSASYYLSTPETRFNEPGCQTPFVH